MPHSRLLDFVLSRRAVFDILPSKRFRTPTYVEHSGRLLYDHPLSQRHKSKHGEVPKIVPAVRQTLLYQTKLCATKLRLRAPVNSHKAAPG